MALQETINSLKVGDKIRVLDNNNNIHNGIIGEIDSNYCLYFWNNSLSGEFGIKLSKDYQFSWRIYYNGDSVIKAITILNTNLTNKKFMTLKEKFVLSLTKEPQKSFRKVGITDGDDLLTSEGERVFLSWLLHKKYAEDFKKEVVNDLSKQEEKKERKDE